MDNPKSNLRYVVVLVRNRFEDITIDMIVSEPVTDISTGTIDRTDSSFIWVADRVETSFWLINTVVVVVVDVASVGDNDGNNMVNNSSAVVFRIKVSFNDVTFSTMAGKSAAGASIGTDAIIATK